MESERASSAKQSVIVECDSFRQSSSPAQKIEADDQSVFSRAFLSRLFPSILSS